MKLGIQIMLVFLLWGIALGQSASAPMDTSSPERVVSFLTSASTEQRASTARLLQLREPWEQGTLCVEYEKVELTRPVLEAGSETALVTITASDCDFIFLVPFVVKGNRWTPAGTVPLWTKYSSPKYRIQSLVKGDESEIVITGQTVDSGTGIIQRNMTILKIVDDSTRVVFDQPEALNVSVPVKVNGKLTNTQDEESSSFALVNSEAFVPGVKSIVETRVIHVAGRTTTIYRKYIWSPVLSMFRMYGTGLSGEGAAH